MKNRRITLHVFLVLVTALAVVWTTRSHASSHPIIASLDESPMVVYGDEQPNNTGDPDGGQIRPPLKPVGSGVHGDELGFTRSDLVRWTWMYWRTVIARFTP